MRRPAVAVAALLACLSSADGAVPEGVPVPAMCAEDAIPADARALDEVRAEVERLSEVEPRRVVQLLCATLARVVSEHGSESAELGEWLLALATPLIAYFDRHDEALPLLEYAEPILRRELGPYANEISDIHVAHAWINFRRGNLDAAGAAWERALAVREHNPGAGRIELQKVLVGLAQVRIEQRNFDGAREALDRARDILDTDGVPVSEAAAAIASAFTRLALREEDFAAAEEHAERLLAIELEMASPAAQLVTGYTMLAQIRERLDEFEAAEVAMREAIRLADADADAPLQRHRLTALTQLAATLLDRGKAREAQPIADRAVAEGEATLGGDAPRLVRVLDVRAEVHRALGDLPGALRDYLRADSLVDRHGDDVELPVQIAHFRGLGALYASLGDASAARAALLRALEVAGDEPTLATQRAEVLVALGTHDLGQSRQRRLARLGEAAELLRRKLPDTHPRILAVTNERCGLELTGAAAASDCEAAAEQLASTRFVEPGLASRVLLNLSRWHEALGDADGAFARGVESLAAAEALATPEPRWRAYFGVARLLMERGETGRGIFFGKRSLADIERLRGHFVADDRRFDRSFLGDKTTVYRTVADWLIGEGRIDEGLEVLRLLKGEEQHDFVLRGALTWPAETERVSLTAAESALLAAYAAVVAGDPVAGAEIEALAQLRATERISRTESNHLDRLLASQEARTAARALELRAWLAVPYGSTDRERPSRVVESATIVAEQARLGDDAVLAVYLLGSDRLRILIATRRGLISHEERVDAVVLRQQIGRFLDGLTRRQPIESEQSALYTRLAQPVEAAARAAGAKRWVLWLDGALRYVPFAALTDGTAVLAERYALEVYARSPRARPAARERTVRERTVRGLGVTRALAGHPALPAVADELCGIVRGPIVGLKASEACAGRGVLDGAAYVDAAFTESRLRELLAPESAYDVLHLGTHFALRPGNALRSYLLLGDGSRLTLDVLGGLDFGGRHLVTLSACQTGLGSAMGDDGREVEGLAALVKERGAGKVVASLWQVEDASTARLMREFYAGLAARLDAAQALTQAMRTVRTMPGHAHPYYWAGFFVTAG